MMALIASLIFLLTLLGCLAAGVYLLIRSRSSVEAYPRCGHCGYNLTGSISNRCSECGRLFIEAGVFVRRARRSRSTLAVGLILIIIPLVFSFGAVATGLIAARATRESAVAAQQRALAAQAQAQLQAVQQALNRSHATMPSSEESAGRAQDTAQSGAASQPARDDDAADDIS